ncbi:MAG: right-handed parallel beta-helix repeat-containing protein [Verrucomicrobiota bacterium]|nr:right-handed parallel beta-helix repeat-containing protein [Verrucomicrobiota bacterium]
MCTLSSADFGIFPDSGLDSTLLFQQMLKAARAATAPVQILFEPGRYDFHPEHAEEHFCFLSNNDEGLKRAACWLDSLNDITVDGQGATFILHGQMAGFLCFNCRGLTLKNFTVDWERPFLTQARITGSSPSHLDIEFDEDESWRTSGGKLLLRAEGWESALGGLLEVDPHTRAPAYRSGDHCGAPWHSQYLADQSGARGVRLVNTFSRPGIPGNSVVLTDHSRLHPVIALTGCDGVLLENIRIHHALAMAVLAQRSANLTLRRVDVCLAAGSKRLFTACADATHFVNCAGHIQMEDCLHENMLDDATNIHGIYAQVTDRLDAHTLLVKRVHAQQKGAFIAMAGDTVRLVKGGSLVPLGEVAVESVENINREFVKITFATHTPLADRGVLVENLTWTPSATIRRCTVHQNRARGYLLSTPRKTLVEDCTFSPGGPAVMAAGEGRYWFESGAVEDLTLRNNRFIDCCRGPWGRAVIDISPSLAPEPDGRVPFHKNIRIEGNVFETFDHGILYADNVADLVFRGNTVKRTATFTPYGEQFEPVVLTHCTNAVVKE